jgi:rhamnosyltransferase
MKTWASVVVTYRPKHADIRNLLGIADNSGILVVVDNTDSNSPLKFEISENIHIIKNGSNIGLAAALNKGIQYAGQNNFENIFIFDQDTIVDSTFFRSMINFKKSLNMSACAFCAPNFIDRNSLTFAKFPVIGKFIFSHEVCPGICAFIPGRILISITSGTLISYQSYLRIGTLKENYFIDFIDNEYCLRAAKKGLYVAVNCDAQINHSIGCRSVRRLFGMTIKPNNHFPIRRYYIARNGIRTALDYYNRHYSYLFLLLLRFVHELISIIIYEQAKSSKVKAFLIGIIDGFFNKMGSSHRKF